MLISQVLILVDPKVQECKADNSNDSRDYNNTLYRNGYADFTRWSDALKAFASQEPGPSRESPYDDISYYVARSLAHAQEPTPQVFALIVKKFAIVNIMASVDYVRSFFNSLEYRLMYGWADIQHITGLETTLTELYRWNVRLSGYCEAVQTNLDGLRIIVNGETEVKATKGGWSSCDEDFLFLHGQVRNMKNRSNELISYANGLLTIMETKRSLEAAEASLRSSEASAKASAASLDEARAVTRLTFVGMLFLPLGFTSGLFSMGQEYGPGQSQFWVYWTVALPLVSLVFVGYFIVGSAWLEKKKEIHIGVRKGTVGCSGNRNVAEGATRV
jgi:hypothetical protein